MSGKACTRIRLMKINVTSTDKLAAAITEAEGQSRVRLIAPTDVQRAVARIEKRLVDLLPKKVWSGLRFEVNPAGESVANAYKGVPMSTHVTVERFPSGWFVTQIRRHYSDMADVRPLNLAERGEAITEFVTAAHRW